MVGVQCDALQAPVGQPHVSCWKCYVYLALLGEGRRTGAAPTDVRRAWTNGEDDRRGADGLRGVHARREGEGAAEHPFPFRTIEQSSSGTAQDLGTSRRTCSCG